MTEIWDRRETFVLAATGSAVGLGNIWRFPYVVAENGGGAFVLLYLAIVLLFCFPLMLAEVALGRKGRGSPPQSLKNVAKQSGASTRWSILGIFGVITGLLIVAFYSVIGGWALAYTGSAILGTAQQTSAEVAGAHFGSIISGWSEFGWFVLFLGITVGIIAGGVKAGLERAILIVMPILFLLLIVMFGYSALYEDMGSAVSYLFSFQTENLTGDSVLAAMGQAFFSLSIGLGALMTYGAYIPEKVSLGKSVLVVALIDTLVAVLAGLIIFSILFSHDIEPGSGGPSLVFVTMTLAFGKMALGGFFAFVFFLLLSLAALSSSISLIEPATAYLGEKVRWSRVRSCIAISLVLCVLGGLSAIYDPVLNFLDTLTANYMLPLGGVMISIFVGFWGFDAIKDLPGLPKGRILQVWRVLLRYVVPVGVAVVFFNTLIS